MDGKIHNKETLLYGCKKESPDYMEEILHHQKGYVNRDKLISAYSEWAEENGYDRLRISVIDLSIPPDFKSTVNIQAIEMNKKINPCPFCRNKNFKLYTIGHGRSHQKDMLQCLTPTCILRYIAFPVNEWQKQLKRRTDNE